MSIRLFTAIKGSFWLLLTAAAASCGSASVKKTNRDTSNMSKQHQPENLDTAVLAGGCFWCLDAVYREMKGVVTVESGYANGSIKNPSYREVCTGRTGHAEVVKIIYDTTETSFADILEVFWVIHNPTTLNRQGNDVGTQYRSGIYFMNEAQRDLALKSRDAAQETKLWEGTYVTEIVPLTVYYPAEDYHQDYYTNNPDQAYCVYVVKEKVEKFKKAFREKVKQTP